jgi:hypothetical protein
MHCANFNEGFVMTYWRTIRAIPGGNRQSPGSHSSSKYALPSNSILPARPSFELSEISKPSSDELEMGAGFLFLTVVLCPPLIVGALVVLYLLLVSEPI